MGQGSEGRGCHVGCLYWLLVNGKPLEPWPLGGTASPMIAPVISPKSSRCPPVAFSGEYEVFTMLPEPPFTANLMGSPVQQAEGSTPLPGESRQRLTLPQVEGSCVRLPGPRIFMGHQADLGISAQLKDHILFSHAESEDRAWWRPRSQDSNLIVKGRGKASDATEIHTSDTRIEGL